MLTKEYISGIIKNSKIEVTKMGRKTTVLLAILPNGFEVVVSSACVNPVDYSENIGREICMGRLEDKVWELEVYISQQDIADMRGGKSG